MISCHIDISKELSLEAAHAVATQVEEKIKAVLPEAKEVLVHTEPTP
jgi:divalent metal cation (Fe/Co/Zn/Cd) transporter